MPEPTNEQIPDAQKPGRSRSSKPFPLLTFEESLPLAEKILEDGIDGGMRRLTLLDKLSKSPTSSATRTLITCSSKYGLTSGSYNASSLKLTDEGRALVALDVSPERIQKAFDLAIARIEPFRTLYEKLKDKRLPDQKILCDELGQLGITEADRERCATIFVANVRYLDLVEDVNNVPHVRPVEEVTRLAASTEPDPDAMPPSGAEPGRSQSTVAQAPTGGEDNTQASVPSLHIDVQVHIDATASAKQIDQIFSSMARHLYGRNE